MANRRRSAVEASWYATGYVVAPASTQQVMAALGQIGVYRDGQRFAWRGMSSVDYRVSSTLHRSLENGATEAQVRATELDTIERAHDWNLGTGRLGTVDDLQLLADLQHYGVPTRLIDFTANPMTALWFACQEPSVEGAWDDGLVLALNITELEVATSGLGSGTWNSLGDPTGHTLSSHLHTGAPFVVRGVEGNVRLVAQEGLFVTGAVPEDVDDDSVFQSISVPFTPLEAGSLDLVSARPRGGARKLPFAGIVIKRALKARLLRHLEGSYNRTARELFPDYPGFREFGLPTGSREPSAAVESIEAP